MEIIWSSLFTLIACTWSIHHPNVPEQRDGRDPGWKGDLYWGLKSVFESAKLALITVIAPMIIISVAWDQRRIAKKVQRELSKQIERSDPFLKVIAIVQIMWSIFQIVARAVRGLLISLLELNVLALAACAVIISILCWDKPNHVQVATTIMTYDGEIPEEVHRRLKEVETSVAWSKVVRNTGPFKGAPHSNTRILNEEERAGDEMGEEVADCEEMGNEKICDEEMGGVKWDDEGEKGGNKKLYNEKRGAAAFLFVAATLLGAVHMAGWNISFPTPAEQIIWRCAAIYILTVPCMTVLLYPIGRLLGRILCLRDDTVYDLSSSGETGLSWVYIVARLFVLVEMVRTFAFLPPDVLIVIWTTNIPHFA